MFVNILYYFNLILYFSYNYFTYSECTIVSNSKNGGDFSAPHVLLKNIYGYEPYRGYRTLWRPTLKRSNNKFERPLPTRSKPTVNQYLRLGSARQPLTTRTKKSYYWHNFEDHEQAWPKVLLILSTSLKPTTSKRAKMTFASYFPPATKYLTKGDTTSDDQITTVDNETPEETFLYPYETTNVMTTTSFKETFDKDTYYSKNTSHKKYRVNTTPLQRWLSPATMITPATMTRTTRQKYGLLSNKMRCYECGLNQTNIPENTCHRIFESEERMYYSRRIYLVRYCEDVSKDNRTFIGGCFKRFLDIGDVYNERGCRTWKPMMGKSYASSRLMMLEINMQYMSEGCISSPHASLTPFSRAVSLYARYHVCVCDGMLCNKAPTLNFNVISLMLINIILRI